MRATGFEFRYRFMVIGLIFWVGFAAYTFDRVNAGSALAGWLAVHTGLHSVVSLRIIFAICAVITVFAALLRTWATSYLHINVVHDSALHSERVVAGGPYRYL